MKALLILFLALPASAALTGDFETRARPENLKPFALDLGGVLGAAGVDTGRSWGFPGFEAGIVAGGQFKPSDENTILRGSGVKQFGVPMVSAGVGLPLRFAVVAHGMSYGGAKVIGGGLRWSVFEPPVVGKVLPTAGASVFVDKVSHGAFTATHYAANLSVGWALPMITPFAAAGYDLTQVKVDAGAFPGIAGQSAWARGGRIGVGADVTPFPFLRIRGAYQMLHGRPGATLGLLAKF